MNVTVRLQTRLRAAAALIAATLAVMLTGCSVSTPGGGSDQTVPVSQPAPTVLTSPGTSADALRIVLPVGDGLATATLDDTPAAREFAAMLPLQLNLHDPMGQAKSGQLPRRIDLSGADPVFDPSVGEIYYWPPSGDIGIVYDDLGQSVPQPGMVRLGILDSGLDAIASAGNRFIIRIYPVGHASF
jgi:hypothetical protein